MALTAGARRPSALTVRSAWRWASENLFGSVANTVLTVTTFLFVWFALIAIPGVVEFPPFGIAWFVVDAADWEVITTNRKLFFIGRVPADETWRLWVILLPLTGLAGLSWGLWSSIRRRLAAMFVMGVVLIFLFTAEGDDGKPDEQKRDNSQRRLGHTAEQVLASPAPGSPEGRRRRLGGARD